MKHISFFSFLLRHVSIIAIAVFTINSTICSDRIISNLKINLDNVEPDIGSLSIKNTRTKKPHPNQDRIVIDNTGPYVTLAVFDGHGPYGHEVAQAGFDYLKEVTDSRRWSAKEEIELDFRAINDTIIETPRWYNSGTTGTIILVDKKTLEATIGWAGDSRALLIRNNKIILETEDHNPSNSKEFERLSAIKAQIKWYERGQIEINGIWKPFTPQLKEKYPTAKTKDTFGRVAGLAMTRSLGDKQKKIQAAEEQTSKTTNTGLDYVISSVPEIKTIKIEQGDILVVASDGLWELVDNTGVLQTCIGMHTCSSVILAESLSFAVKHAAKKYTHGVHDDVSIIVVKFGTNFETGLSNNPPNNNNNQVNNNNNNNQSNNSHQPKTHFNEKTESENQDK